MTLKFIITIAAAAIAPVICFGQRLPSVQAAGYKSPQNVKIDGKLTEWGTVFQAYNHSADISYTISNDTENLYLIIQATEHTNINKILGGGIVFSLNYEDQKNLKQKIDITYPVLDADNRVWVNLKAQPEAGISKDAAVKWADSVMIAKNREFISKSKMIKVNGLQGTDTIISVYNRDGLKAAASFDSKLAFTCEISMSLAKLGISVNKTGKIGYKITLPGVDIAAVYAAAGQATTVTSGYVVPIGKLPGYTDEFVEKHEPSLPTKVHMVDFTSRTGFNGEYTLATN